VTDNNETSATTFEYTRGWLICDKLDHQIKKEEARKGCPIIFAPILNPSL
jgi:hypothetical protein